MFNALVSTCSAVWSGLAPDEAELFDTALDGLYLVYRRVAGGWEASVRSRSTALPDAAALADAAERLGELKRLGRAVRLKLARDIPDLVGTSRVFLAVSAWDLLDPELADGRSCLHPHRDRIVLRVDPGSLPDAPAARHALARIAAAGWLLASA